MFPQIIDEEFFYGISMETDKDQVKSLLENKSESSLIARVQMILAEKRTSLSVLRTGIAVLSLPMAIVALLTATSGLYDLASTLHLLIPLFVLNSVLVVLGSALIYRAFTRILRHDKLIAIIKEKNPELGKLIEIE